MKISKVTIFRILIFIVLGGKLMNAFFPFSESVKQGLNTAMFILIGIALLTACYFWEMGWRKIIFGICGTYLIVMNFLPDFDAQPLIGIACMVVPALIMGFSKEKKELAKE